MPDSSGISELADCQSLLDKLEQRLRQEIEQRQLTDPIMIGIHSGGVWIAEELHRRLGISEPLGKLDITFYRDDFSQIGMHPQVQASQLPFTLEGRDILLIDDVFYTGRTIRAALNEIFDYGRPSQILLGVLIERDGREIPLRPDCAGGTLTLPTGQRIKLTGPAPLALSVHTLRKAA
jgi:pyrimidine operon attenuation protein/uracil phosphoribosyltransferase